MKPICVKCQRFYRVRKNGYMFIESMPASNHAPPGKQFAHLWQPYKLWRGDLWKCDGCGHLIVSGVSAQPIDEHYTHSFAKNLAAIEEENGPLLRVNDC
jgi:hypothetical protein